MGNGQLFWPKGIRHSTWAQKSRMDVSGEDGSGGKPVSRDCHLAWLALVPRPGIAAWEGLLSLQVLAILTNMV